MQKAQKVSQKILREIVKSLITFFVNKILPHWLYNFLSLSFSLSLSFFLTQTHSNPLSRQVENLQVGWCLIQVESFKKSVKTFPNYYPIYFIVLIPTQYCIPMMPKDPCLITRDLQFWKSARAKDLVGYFWSSKSSVSTMPYHQR